MHSQKHDLKNQSPGSTDVACFWHQLKAEIQITSHLTDVTKIPFNAEKLSIYYILPLKTLTRNTRTQLTFSIQNNIEKTSIYPIKELLRITNGEGTAATTVVPKIETDILLLRDANNR